MNRNIKTVFVLIVMSLFFLTCSPLEFKKLSRNLDEVVKDEKGTLKGYTFHEIRLKLLKDRNKEILKGKLDSIFLLEKFSAESGTYYGRLWNRADSLSYTYFYLRDSFDYSNNNLFTNYTIRLINSWDTSTLRKEGSLNEARTPSYTIYGSRIIKQGKEYKIDTITFKEFINIERDRN